MWETDNWFDICYKKKCAAMQHGKYPSEHYYRVTIPLPSLARSSVTDTRELTSSGSQKGLRVDVVHVVGFANKFIGDFAVINI